MKEKLVLAGAGMAGVRVLEDLLHIAPDRYEITVFGAEPYGNYNRILLSAVLSGEKAVDEIMLNDAQWYEKHGIRFYPGQEIIKIDRMRRRITAGDGIEAPYDRLIIATGSRPIVIPVPGLDLPGVLTFRDLGDVATMLDAASKYRKAVVIGGGLLGLEAANGLMKQGMQVTVVHLLDLLMERQLDRQAAALLKASLEARSLRFLMEHQTEAILGQERVCAVRFTGGQELPADLVIMAVGIRPNIQLARDAGLYCERGIVVSDTMQTYDPRIYAVGECIQHRGQTYGLVAPLYEQARVCANHLAGPGFADYYGSLLSTTLKVTGVSLFSAGEFQGGRGYQDLIFKDPARGVYRKLVLRDNRVRGAVFYGEVQDSAWYLGLMRQKADVAPLRQQLIFGRAHAEESQSMPVEGKEVR